MLISKKIEYFVFSILLLIAFLLRLYKLSEFSLWNDEFVIMFHHSRNISLSNLLIEPHPPLYFLFFGIWTNLFGTSAFCVRFPSVIFSIVSLIFFYLYSKRLFGTKVGLIALSLATFSNILINYSQEAKNYSLLYMFLNISFYYFILLLEHNRFKLNYFIFISLAFITNYLTLFIMLFQIPYLIIKNKIHLKDILILIGLNTISFISLIYNLIFNKSAYNWVAEFALNAVKPTFNLFSGIYVRGATFEISYMLALFLIFLTIGLIYHLKDRKYILLLLHFVIPFSLIIICSVWVIHLYTYVTIRYVSYFAFFFLLLVSVGIESIKMEWLSALICIFLFMTALLPYYSNEIKMDGENWKQTINNVRSFNLPLVAYGGIEKYIIDYYMKVNSTEIYDDSLNKEMIVLARPSDKFPNVKNIKNYYYQNGVLVIYVASN